MRSIKPISAAVFVASNNLALAEKITFAVDNEFTEDVTIEFDSAERDYVRPGGDQIWVVACQAAKSLTRRLAILQLPVRQSQHPKQDRGPVKQFHVVAVVAQQPAFARVFRIGDHETEH